jgi:hypothetical protein
MIKKERREVEKREIINEFLFFRPLSLLPYSPFFLLFKFHLLIMI